MSDNGKPLDFIQADNFMKRYAQPKKYAAYIEYATMPTELLMNAMGILVGEPGVRSLDENYLGQKEVTKNEHGLEVRRYGRLVLTEVRPIVNRQ